MLAPLEKSKRVNWFYSTTLGTIALELACYVLIFVVVFSYIWRAFP
jgi:hypothetical protein